MTAPAPAAPLSSDLPVDAATLYPEGDGFLARRAKARREKLLAGIGDVLRRALGPGETIRYAARGIRYYVLEHMFGGAAVSQYQNMTALVLTDRRLLLVQIGRSGKPHDVKNEIPLAAVRRARRGLTGFRLELADGTKPRFVSVSGRDGKALAALLPDAERPYSSTPSVVHLCPACLRPVPGKVGAALVCPQQDCRIPFRDPRRAARLSALVPGLGDLYLRHHFFGSIEFLGSMLMLGLGVAFALEAAAERDAGSVAAAVTLGLFFVGLPRLIDYFLTLHMGRKGLIPLALAPAPGAQARNLPSYPRWSPILFVAGIAVAGALVAVVSQDLRADVAAREARELAARGQLDEAQARWAEVERQGNSTEERRVKFALALLEAGDLTGAEAIEEKFQGAKIDKHVVDRWNAAIAKKNKALEDYEQGLKLLVAGDPSAWARLDPALAYFAAVKRPHLPKNRGELAAHLAMGVLAEPLGDGDAERARRFVDDVADAPAPEAAAVRAAYASASGRTADARSALAALDASALPAGFRLLVLEARARVAADGAERAAVREAAGAFPRAGLGEGDTRRLDALVGRLR